MIAPMPIDRLKNAWPSAMSTESPVSAEKSGVNRNLSPSTKAPVVIA